MRTRGGELEKTSESAAAAGIRVMPCLAVGAGPNTWPQRAFNQTVGYVNIRSCSTVEAGLDGSRQMRRHYDGTLASAFLGTGFAAATSAFSATGRLPRRSPP